MITWTKRLLLTLSFLVLITANVLILTSTAFTSVSTIRKVDKYHSSKVLCPVLYIPRNAWNTNFSN